MNNKTSTILIGISLIIAFIGYTISEFKLQETIGEIMFGVGLSTGQLIGLIMLVRNGTLTKTIYFRFISGFISITILGTMFKIMHWKSADMLLMIGLAGIALSYFIRFIFKKQKGLLDVLKVLWVFAAYIGGGLIILHFIPSQLIHIAHGLLWITILYFIILEFNSKRLTIK